MKDDILFYCPVDIVKATDKDGKEIMRLEGIASTMDEDSDGEFLDPAGFEISDFKKVGLVNWHHQASDSPKTIIGEPYLAEIRKEGFYVGSELYPSSELAKEVYELAEVMQKDSKSRKLGYSIEGTVLERDEKNPKIVKRAKITGIAITHMPKNAKTFAEIIKACNAGKLEKDSNEEEVEEKSLSTESGAAIMPESVDGSKKKKHLKNVTTIEKSNYKIKNLTQEARYDLIFDCFPDITIEKAEEVYNLFSNIQKAMSTKTKNISNEQIKKAMDVLGFDDLDSNPFLEKSEAGKELDPDKVADAVSEKIFKAESDEDAKEEEAEEKEETMEKAQKGTPPAEAVEETINKGAVLILKKAIEHSSAENLKNARAIGVLVKGVLQRNGELAEQNTELKKAMETMKEDLSERLEKAEGMLNSFGGAPQARRSLRKAIVPREKESFQKAQEENKQENVLSKSRDYKQVLDLVDNAAFAKGGYDEHFGKAVTSFEATKTLPGDVISRIKTEFGITIVD